MQCGLEARPHSPNPGFFGPKSWPLQKSRGKNPKTWILTYFAILNMMLGSKIAKNFCGKKYKICHI
jgi:hypothetical protein